MVRLEGIIVYRNRYHILFQFQYGAIEGLIMQIPDNASNSYFNSSMVRLRVMRYTSLE